MISRVTPADPGFGAVAELFDAYRAHYGLQREFAATRRWLQDRAETGFRVYAARPHRLPVGFATVAVVPASLTLGTVWLLRDLWVDPGHRGAGHGRALVGHVLAEARADGARRVSLTTEHDNAAAQALYRSLGFEPVEGYLTLNAPL
ncbi:GNAT family N-acetyltransferase [Catellatospora sp. KI3]|uniref:GNAT family N-acetyltransferase n=1 Tax=Catellatospora sp. KI3 TaxID=3041620 RepID=UPI0024830914|nr:GNAT family N-acetyltransferase [Catellatospora sp. KI3]MDI1459989.1 GNAT family N-acetyltransferase [Catellatospora sp. KI3]